MLINLQPEMRLLLLKSSGQFKHSGKYYLLNGRWHALHQDKPVPKGAAVAAHPHAAGAPTGGATTFTDEQWAQLKLPAENSNASTFNKQVDQLKAAAAAGDVTGILGSGYGTNTYGKKLAILANNVLKMLGSTHTVNPGQKPGAHAAVQTAPQIEAGQAAPAPESAPADEKPQSDQPVPDVTLTDEGKTPPAAAEGTGIEAPAWKPSLDEVLGLYKLPKDQQVATLKEWQKKLGGNAQLMQVLQDAQAEAKKNPQPLPKKPASAPAQNPKPAPEPVTQYAPGDVITGPLNYLPPGSVVSFHDGAQERQALIGKGNVWFNKLNGGGWQKNPLTPQQTGGFISGKWTKGSGAKVVGIGHKHWLSDEQKVHAQSFLKIKTEKGYAAQVYRLGSSIVVGEIGNPYNFVWIGEDGKWGAGFSDSDKQKLTTGEGLEPVDINAAPDLSADKVNGIVAGLTKGGAPQGVDQHASAIDAALKGLGITAKVKDAGKGKISVSVVDAQSEFGEPQKKAILQLGVALGMTGVMGTPLDPSGTADPQQINLHVGTGAKAPEGPKEGDTKPAADGGVLVLKDGRWKKQEQADAVSDAVAQYQAKHAEFGTPTITYNGEEFYVLNTGATSADGKVYAHLAHKTDGSVQKNGFVPKQAADWVDPGKIKDPKKKAPASPQVAASGLDMPSFDPGSVGQSVVDYYEKVGQKVIDLAMAGDVSGLESLKLKGLQPNGKGKVGNTWKGKTENSKTLLKLHAAAIEHAKGGAVQQAVQHLQQDQQQADIPASEKKEDAELVQQIHAAPSNDAALDTAVDHLKNDKDQADLPAAEKKEDAVLVQKLEAAQGATAERFEVTASGYLAGKNGYIQQYANLKQAHAKADQMKAAGYDVHVTSFHPFKIVVNAKPSDAKKEPRLVLPKTVPAPATPASNDKLAQINWDGQKLPDSNKNAKSHNKQVEKIKALALAGDMAGLEALKFGTNTYGKKQELLKQTAIAALKEGGAPAPAATPAPVDAGSIASTLTADMKSKLNALEQDGDLKPGAKVVFQSYLQSHPGDIQGAIDEVTAYGWHYSATKLKETFIDSTAPAADKSALTPQKKDVIDTLAENAEHGGVVGLNAVMSAHPAGSETHEYAKQKLAELQDQGPKDGDTKPGADGMLVFKDGRWHKQNEINPDTVFHLKNWIKNGKPTKGSINAKMDAEWNKLSPKQQFELEALLDADQKPAAKPQKMTAEQKKEAFKAAIEAIPVPDFLAADPHKNAAYYGPLCEKIKQAIQQDGMAGFKKYVTVGKDGTFTVKPNAAGFKTGKCSQTDYLIRRQLFWSFCSQVKNALDSQKGTATPKKAAQPAAPVASNVIEAMDAWTQTGPQGGSNPGGRFKDENGVEWYCKFPGDDDVAKAEVLAAKLYAAAGVAGQDAKLITKDGKIGIASRWVTVSKAPSPSALSAAEGTQAGFGVDAWLANWDVVGLGYDNLQIGADGKAVRVDAGGSLMYRAQGGKKAFGDTVSELDTLRDPKINPQAASVFGGMTDADITASVAKVLKLTDTEITALVYQHGPGDMASKKALVDTLLARKADLAAKFPKAMPKPSARQAKAPVYRIPTPPDFANWNGGGQGLSSKAVFNKQNTEIAKNIYQAGLKGDVEEAKSLTYQPINSNGETVGSEVSVRSHPSQHIPAYFKDVLKAMTTPYVSSKITLREALNTMSQAFIAVRAMFPGFKKLKDAAVKIGRYAVLGKLGAGHPLEGWSPVLKSRKQGTLDEKYLFEASQKGFASLSNTEQQAIKDYTGSSYDQMNSALIQGVNHDKAYNAIKGMEKASVVLPVGAVISRRFSFDKAEDGTKNKQNHENAIAQILAAGEGAILQEFGIISTSTKSNFWHGKVHLKITVGEGVKGLYVASDPGTGSGKKPISLNPGESEIMLPYGTKFMVTKIHPKGHSFSDDTGSWGTNYGDEMVIEVTALPNI